MHKCKCKWYRPSCSSAIRVNVCHKEGQSYVLTDERSSGLTLRGLRHRTFSARKLAGVWVNEWHIIFMECPLASWLDAQIKSAAHVEWWRKISLRWHPEQGDRRLKRIRYNAGQRGSDPSVTPALELYSHSFHWIRGLWWCCDRWRGNEDISPLGEAVVRSGSE